MTEEELYQLDKKFKARARLRPRDARFPVTHVMTSGESSYGLSVAFARDVTDQDQADLMEAIELFWKVRL